MARFWAEEEAALKQKSRDQRISLGDSNTKYFYNLFKTCQNHNSIWSIKNSHGDFVYGDEVFKVATTYYESLLGAQLDQCDQPSIDVRGPISPHAYNLINAPVTLIKID